MAEEREHNLTGKKQRFLSALLNCPTVKGACRKAGITEPTGHKYLHHDETFAAALRDARRQVFSRGLLGLSQGMMEAVSGLRWCLRQCRKAKDAKGVKEAAEAILAQVGKLMPGEAVEDRLAALEEALFAEGEDP